MRLELEPAHDPHRNGNALRGDDLSPAGLSQPAPRLRPVRHAAHRSAGRVPDRAASHGAAVSITMIFLLKVFASADMFELSVDMSFVDG